MKLKLLLAWGLIAILICGLAALAADSGSEYQKAVTLERAGKLDDAIKLYQSVAKEFGSDRALAAKALVQAARCYEKLGQDKAVKIYEQVAREFGDQRESAQTASRRLAALRQASPAPVTMTQHRIEPAGEEVFYSDGQRNVYRDAATNSLVIADVEGKIKRAIYKAKQGESFSAFAPSRDLSMVWLRLHAAGGQVTHAVIKIDGTGYRELFQGFLYGAEAPDSVLGQSLSPFRGRPARPGRRASRRSRKSGFIPVGGGMAVVSVSDGKGRTVLRREGSIQRATFSPDGRFIAFSVEEAHSFPRQKTFVTPTQVRRTAVGFRTMQFWWIGRWMDVLPWRPPEPGVRVRRRCIYSP